MTGIEAGEFVMTLPFKLISADSHISEPPDLWTKRIDRRYLERAPRIVTRDDGDFFIIDGKVSIAEGAEHGIGLIATKRKYTNPEGYDFGFKGWWRDVPEASYEPDARVKEMDREGIEAELLYTTFGLQMYAIPDVDYRYACFQAFNDWLAEYCAAAPKRLFGIAMIPTDNIDRDVRELERCKKIGLAGAMISINHKSGEAHSDKKFEKLWAAAEELGMPLSLHVAASETGFTQTGNMFADFSCGFTPTMYTITAMIFSGMLDRYPKLKVLSVENDASWSLSVLERMDDRWQHDKAWAWGAAMTSGRKPSEIFHDQVACTFMRDRTAIVNRDIIGKGNILWGSDYPHFDGAWPNSSAALERQFGGVPLEDQIRIGRTNAIDIYKLPIAH
jgi:predicted TIM-barrel fold metal-dependent hydrolase